VGTGIISRE